MKKMKIGTDKILHFGCSFVAQVTAGVCFGNPIGLAFTAGLGIGKEVGDKIRGCTWKESFLDIVADALGIVFGAFLVVIVRRAAYGW